MEKKNAVIREAEEIIEHYIKKQQGISRHFHKKSKREIQEKKENLHTEEKFVG